MTLRKHAGLFALLALVAPLCGAVGQVPPCPEPDSGAAWVRVSRAWSREAGLRWTNDSLRRVLLALYGKDQTARAGFGARVTDTLYARQLISLDSTLAASMAGILDRFGLPTKSMVGPAGSRAAMGIVQHNWPLQERVLALAKALPVGEVPAEAMALLEDRVLMHQGKPQLLGTQFNLDTDGVFRFVPVADTANLDMRRAAAGLPPLTLYVCFMEESGMRIDRESLPRHAGPEPPGTSRSLAFTHATVIDVVGGSRRTDVTVVVQGNRITAVDASAHATVPQDAQVIDARGKYLIPGLWDMHVHAVWPRNAPTFMPLFVANGITGVRDMYGTIALVREAGAPRETATRPRVIGSGHILDGVEPFWFGSVAVGNAAEARRAVDSLRQAGADFIKVYGLLSRDAFFAAATRSRELGIPFAGHVPELVTAAEASDAGQRSIEHLSGVLRGCSTREQEIMSRMGPAIARNDRPALLAALREGSMTALGGYDDEKCAALVARFARNGTWQVPTLAVRRGRAFLDDTALTRDPRLTYVLRGIRDGWQPGRDPRNRVTPSEMADRKRVYRKELEIVALLHKGGVPLLAGTDTPNPYALPGFSLHDELALLVQAGLSPLEALRTATLNPARFLGALDSMGAVAPGKVADLVLLDADPLTDIGNTRRIAGVVLRGRFIDDAARRRMLAEVEQMANRP